MQPHFCCNFKTITPVMWLNCNVLLKIKVKILLCPKSFKYKWIADSSRTAIVTSYVSFPVALCSAPPPLGPKKSKKHIFYFKYLKGNVWVSVRTWIFILFEGGVPFLLHNNSRNSLKLNLLRLCVAGWFVYTLL